MSLPVLEALPRLRQALSGANLALLQAPPGAGKSTGLPLELLYEPWMDGKTMLLLQPRRVAARAVAARLASSLGESVGETVGLRVRFESRVSRRTRIEVVTEGILIRRLQHDPELNGVGLVLFDEFHERSLNADLALALVREVQGALRDDLRVLIMSATLDPLLGQMLGGDAALIESRGRAYPVEIKYLRSDPADPSASVPGAVSRALEQSPGDVLAFLPGVSEIRRAMRSVQEAHPDILVLPLYGDLPVAEQNRALAPDPSGRRKVILATSIAETSLTIDGVRVVIDSGLSRGQQFDPGSGLSRLVTSRVTRDSADQRAGRAGRTAPGVAYRLWSERTQPLLSASRPPEIVTADLAPLVLEVAGWGAELAELPWLDAPPLPRVNAARTLLSELHALNDSKITPEGRALLDFPTHPRLAHLLSRGAELGLGALAADLAALLEERDPLPRSAGSDLSLRILALQHFREGGRVGESAPVLERIERLSAQWRKLLGVLVSNTPPAEGALGRLLFLAYPERAAQLRAGTTERYLLAAGQGARLPAGDALNAEPYLVAAYLGAPEGASSEGRIGLAAPLSVRVLEAESTVSDQVSWDSRTGTLSATRDVRYGRLVLSSQPLSPVPEALRVEAVRSAVHKEGLGSLNWTEDARQWLARVRSLHAWHGDPWPDLSDAALLERLGDWLSPHLGTVRRREDLGKIHLLNALHPLLPWPLPQQLGELAPTHLDVPSGHRVRLEYRPDGSAPILAVKLQELFGLADTPTVNAGRTPVLLHLLSPARRPVQITQDLRSFWHSGYFEVRKDLRGQYPRHPWPDDPWTAVPTRATKKRM